MAAVSDPPSTTSPLPYGPFTAEVRRFLQRVAILTPAAEEEVVVEYQLAVQSAEYQAAERVLGSAIARSNREKERDALGGPLLHLLRADGQLVANDISNASPSITANVAPYRPIAEPALAALLGILMQDVLSADLVARLYAPFAHRIPRTSLQK